MAKSEIPYIILCSIVLGYVISFVINNSNKTPFTYASFLFYSLIALVIISINVGAKKLAAMKLGCYAEFQPLTWRRYWFYESAYLRFGVPSWLIWPLIFTWLSLGKLFWLANNTFEAQATPSRVSRRFADLTEFDIGLIAAAGITANLVAAVVAICFNTPAAISFAYLNLWYAFFNMLPFPGYDGGKLFFGEKLFYVFMFSLTAIMLILLHVKVNVITTIISSFIVALMMVFIFWGLREKV
jgi:Zn-dependent protease